MSDQVQAQSFTEAPASWNIRYLTIEGYECQFTLRGVTGAEVLGKTEAVLEHLTKHGCRPVRQAAPASAATTPDNGNGHPPEAVLKPAQPGQQPAKTGGEQEVIEVKSIAHAVTDTGHHYLKVKGGKYSKYGVKAWSEVVPAEAAAFEEWPIGEEYNPFPTMLHAVVEDGKKVVAFKA